jgi:hypothetical protein
MPSTLETHLIIGWMTTLLTAPTIVFMIDVINDLRIHSSSRLIYDSNTYSSSNPFLSSLLLLTLAYLALLAETLLSNPRDLVTIRSMFELALLLYLFFYIFLLPVRVAGTSTSWAQPLLVQLRHQALLEAVNDLIRHSFGLILLVPLLLDFFGIERS